METVHSIKKVVTTETNQGYVPPIRKSFACLICGLSLSSSEKLKRHIRVHSGEKPYKCKQCSSLFGQSWGLKMHVLKYHSVEKLNKFEQCVGSFVKSSDLQSHIEVHSADDSTTTLNSGQGKILEVHVISWTVMYNWKTSFFDSSYYCLSSFSNSLDFSGSYLTSLENTFRALSGELFHIVQLNLVSGCDLIKWHATLLWTIPVIIWMNLWNTIIKSSRSLR